MATLWQVQAIRRTEQVAQEESRRVRKCPRGKRRKVSERRMQKALDTGQPAQLPEMGHGQAGPTPDYGYPSPTMTG